MALEANHQIGMERTASSGLGQVQDLKKIIKFNHGRAWCDSATCCIAGRTTANNIENRSLEDTLTADLKKGHQNMAKTQQKRDSLSSMARFELSTSKNPPINRSLSLSEKSFPFEVLELFVCGPRASGDKPDPF